MSVLTVHSPAAYLTAASDTSLAVPTMRDLVGAYRDHGQFRQKADQEARRRKAEGDRPQTNRTWNAYEGAVKQQELIMVLLAHHPKGHELNGLLTEEADLNRRIRDSRLPRPELTERLRQARRRIFDLLRRHGEDVPLTVAA